MEVVVVLSESFGEEMTLIQLFLRGAKGMRLVLARNSSSWPGLRRKVVYQRYHHTNPGKHLVHLAYMAMFCRGFKHQRKHAASSPQYFRFASLHLPVDPEGYRKGGAAYGIPLPAHGFPSSIWGAAVFDLVTIYVRILSFKAGRIELRSVHNMWPNDPSRSPLTFRYKKEVGRVCGESLLYSNQVMVQK